VNISAILPLSSMCTLYSLMSAYRNSPGMSNTTTHIFSHASIVQESIIASIESVGELVLLNLYKVFVDAQMHIPVLLL